MAVVTVDSNNVEAILADAGVVDVPAPKDDPKPEDKPADKVVEAEEEEDENGLTESQRSELTAKMQKAIGKKHRQRMEAEEFAAAQYSERKMAEERAAKLERELAELRSKSASQQETKAPEKPVRANFSTEAEFIDATIQFEVDKRLAEKAAADRKAAEEAERAERAETIGKRLDAARELVPDFNDVVNEADAQIPPAVATYMEESEMIAELGYYFAKNPEVLLSLHKLTPHQQLVKVGKIESTLTPFGSDVASSKTQNDSKSSKAAPNGQAKPAPSTDTDIDLSKPRGKAAPVITPLDGTGSAGISKDSKDMNIREAIEDYSKRNKVNLGLRKRH